MKKIFTVRLLLSFVMLITSVTFSMRGPLEEEISPDYFLILEKNLMNDFKCGSQEAIDERKYDKDKINRDNKSALIAILGKLEKDPSGEILLFQKANTLLQLGLPYRARNDFFKIISKKDSEKNKALLCAALLGIGYAYKVMGNYSDAIECYDLLIEGAKTEHCDDDIALVAKRAKVWALLSDEQWDKAHALYRSMRTEKQNALYHLIKENHGVLAGKKVLISKGPAAIGDYIMFGPLAAKQLKKMGASVVWQVHNLLYPLVVRQEWAKKIIVLPEDGEIKEDAFDASVEIMDVMSMLDWHVDKIPAEFPYIQPKSEITTYWSDRLSKDTKIKIGVCFRVGVHNDVQMLPENGYRSFSLKDLLETLQPFFSQVSVYNLQTFDYEKHINALPAELKKNYIVLDDLDGSRGKYEDSAALMANVLDYVFAPNSATYALASIVNSKPGRVGVIVPEAKDWREGKKDRKNSIFFPHVEQIPMDKIKSLVPGIVKKLIEQRKISE